MQLALHPADHTERLTEVHLCMTRRMRQRDKHLPRPPLLLAHIIRDDGDTARETMLIPKPGMNAPGRVTLLLDEPFIVFENLIDDPNESIQLRTNRR